MPTETVDPLTERARDLMNRRNVIDNELQALADERPALTLTEALAMLHAQGETARPLTLDAMDFWRQRSEMIDVTELTAYPYGEEKTGDEIERWERLDTSTRYIVREHGDPTMYAVVDTEGTPDDDIVGETFSYEDEAEEEAARLNEEDREEGLHAFPFAHNWGRVVDGGKYWLEHFQASGIVCYNVYGVGFIAGIDGGGYSFDDAHWVPCYLRIAADKGLTVNTVDGPRRLTNG